MAIINKLTEMKTCLRAVGCASKVNMAKFDKEVQAKRMMEYKDHGQKIFFYGRI